MADVQPIAPKKGYCMLALIHHGVLRCRCIGGDGDREPSQGGSRKEAWRRLVSGRLTA
jgi:hypothetical protein